MKKQTIKNYIGIIIGLILSFNVGLYAWNGLQAQDGDKLSVSKWNEMVSNMLSGSKLDIKQTDGNNIKIGNSFVPTNEKGLSIYYDNTVDASVFMSLQQGVVYKNILINPNGGRVGIGTNNPGGKLGIDETDSGNSNVLALKSANSYGGILFRTAGTTQSSALYANGDALGLWTGGAERFRITLGGHIGIGTTNPENTEGWSRVFNVNGIGNSKIIATTDYGIQTGIFSHDIGFYGAPAGGMVGTKTANPFSIITAGATRMTFLTNGYVGIGRTDPQYMLDVNGAVRVVGAVNTSSDQRYKKDIKTIESPLDKITQLRGVTFNWRTDEFKNKNFPKDNQVGFIAQEVEKVIPQIVTTDTDGYKSVQYSNVTAILVEAVKELKSNNEDLKKENIELKIQNQDILKRLENIEMKIK